MVRFLQKLSLFFIPFLIFPLASANDQVCSRYVSQVAKESGVPKIILASIAYMESKVLLINKKTKQRKISPWPWALNIQGRSVVFQSKDDAVKEIQSHLEKGINNIDCGCCQINFRWHQKAFKNPADILDPLTNIRYAALLLLKHRLTHGSWAKAISTYHSTNKRLGLNYLKKVRKTIEQGNCS